MLQEAALPESKLHCSCLYQAIPCIRLYCSLWNQSSKKKLFSRNIQFSALFVARVDRPGRNCRHSCSQSEEQRCRVRIRKKCLYNSVPFVERSCICNGLYSHQTESQKFGKQKWNLLNLQCHDCTVSNHFFVLNCGVNWESEKHKVWTQNKFLLVCDHFHLDAENQFNLNKIDLQWNLIPCVEASKLNLLLQCHSYSEG